MSEQFTPFTLSGVVIDQGTEKRLSGATIRMETPAKVLSAETNQFGEFTFPSVNEPDLSEEQDAYKVLLYAYSKEGHQQERVPLTIKIDKGQESHYAENELPRGRAIGVSRPSKG